MQSESSRFLVTTSSEAPQSGAKETKARSLLTKTSAQITFSLLRLGVLTSGLFSLKISHLVEGGWNAPMPAGNVPVFYLSVFCTLGLLAFSNLLIRLQACSTQKTRQGECL
jgi:hypothetical protein